MSRLYLIPIVCFVCTFNGFGQTKIGTYLKHAQEKYKNGDYVYALELYEQAMQIDSNSIDILWEYAETLRAYKDYRKATIYYQKVYERENGLIYPNSQLYYGLMLKQTGQYEEALNTFKKVKSQFKSEKDSYPYLKSVREIESCSWALDNKSANDSLIFKRLLAPINSEDSEFGHLIWDDKLIFSSLKADSVGSDEEVYAKNYKTQLYSYRINHSEDDIQRIEALSESGKSIGNGSFSIDSSRFYYSNCEDDAYNYACKIMVAEVVDSLFNTVDSLGEIINKNGFNTTMPAIGQLDGKEVLFFSSDRNGGKGGMDIWFSYITNGNQYSEPVNLEAINSIDNEVSPWWDDAQKQLYYSSSWFDGFGGFDVFKSDYKSYDFSEPINIGLPYNSPANDLYYFKDADTAYFSSNRIGVNYSKNPTCCSDIFKVNYPKRIPIPKIDTLIIPPIIESLYELSKRLPVTLYFHNDCPNPKSLDTLTKINYIDGYYEYRAMLDKYQTEFTVGMDSAKSVNAKKELEDFFINYVDKGVNDLALFRDLLLTELQNGAKINVLVKGFASPLAKTSYNVKLTKRRISSLVNYLSAYDNGIFKPYLKGNAENGGKVIFTMVPFGEYTANKATSDDYYDQRNSVYSKAAAIERKVEIQSISYMENDKIFPLASESSIYDLGKTNSQNKLEQTFNIQNLTSGNVVIESITSPYSFVSTEASSTIISGKKSSTIKLTIDPAQLTGLNMIYVEVKIKDFNETLKLMLTFEVVE
jgi:tetratricopeptide (TPR) repeat protein